jgi:hypothetical protein
MTVARILAGLGAAFELVGFSWVIADASAALSREYGEYGEHGLFRRIVFWLRYWLGPPGQALQVSASDNISISGRASATVTTSDETDIERLNRELGELRRDLDQHKQATAQRFSNVEARMTETERRLTERADEIEQRVSELRRTSLRRERRGAQLFMFGIVLTLASALL